MNMNSFKRNTLKLWKYLCAQRPLVRGTYIEYIGVALLFIVLIVVYTNFVLLDPSQKIFTSGPGDATGGFLWINVFDRSLSLIPGFTDMVNYPVGEAMGGPTFVTWLAIWIPMKALSFISDPVTALNLVMAWGYLSMALGMYWLIKRLTGSISVGIFAAFALTFVPYNIYKSSIHIAYIFDIVFILIFAAFLAFWMRPTRIRALLVALAFVLSVYTDGYYLLLAPVMLIGLIITGVLYGVISRYKVRDFLARVKLGLLAIGVSAIAVSPIAITQLSQGDDIQGTLSSSRSPIADELRTYRSNVIDFIVPSSLNPVFENNEYITTAQAYKDMRPGASTNMNYIGFVNIVLVAVGFVLIGVWLFNRKRSSLSRLKEGERRRYVFAGIATLVCVPIFLSFMFSPDVHVLGYTIKLPGQFFIDHDIAFWRIMSRFFGPMQVIIVIFSAYTLWVLLKVHVFSKKWKNLIMAGVASLLILVLALEYATTQNRPSFDFRKNIDGAYYWLKDQDDIKVVAELPLVDPLDNYTSDYLAAQIVHKKKLVNLKNPTTDRVNNALGFANNEEVVDWVYGRGAQAVVTRGEPCDDVTWGTLGYDSKAKDENRNVCIYRISAPATSDTAYVKFGKGFNPSPNQPDPSVAVVKDATSELQATNEKFQLLKNKRVRINAVIKGGDGNVSQGVWRISQDGRELASGQIRAIDEKISASVDGGKPITFTIDATDGEVKLGEFAVANAVAEIIN